MKRTNSIMKAFGLAALLLLGLAAHAQLRFVTVVPAAANASFPDEDGDFPAYIEIRSLETGVLTGHFLTDDASVPNKWQVPAGYILTSGQSIRIFASGKDRKPTGPGGRLHTNFAYDCNVPYCGLFNSQSVLVHTFADRTDRCGCVGLALLKKGSVARTLIPTKDIGLDWTQAGYPDKEWIRGATGVGYDIGKGTHREGLVLYHTLDKADIAGSTVQDTSGPIFHKGTLAGAPANLAAQIKEGLEFKGESATHIRVPHHTELDPGAGSFTVALWFKAARTSSSTAGQSFTEVLVAKQGTSTTPTQAAPGWQIFRTQAGTFVQAVSTSGPKTISLGASSANQWHHAVLVVHRGLGFVAGYLNGKRIGVATISSVASDVIASNADLFEARDLAGKSPFLGSLDDVAIWGRALDDAQVSAIYALGSQGKSILDPGQASGSGQLYAGLIGTDVLVPMRGVNTSAYIRVPFNLPISPGLATGLRLRMQYNDGFIAYLNGAEVARRNVPSDATWNSKALSDRPDAGGLVGELMDLSDYLGVLKQGGNVLAFHGMSGDVAAERFLILPSQLCLEYDRNPAGGGDCVKETNGKDFWIAFPENYVQEPGTPLSLSICIAGPPNTLGIVDIPGLQITGFPRSFSIPASGTLTVALPPVIELKGPDNVETKAVRVTSSADVAVYGTTRMDFTTDTFLGLPVKCLGTEYLVSTYPNVFDGIPVLNGTQLAVVAVANNTEVTITPIAKVGTHSAGQPYTIQLKRGQTYQLRNEAGKPSDLTGTRIVSTKPVAVFGSHRCANAQSVNQFFCDVVVEQLLPVNLWGSSFFVVPLATRKGDTVRLLSSANDNLITLTSAGGNQSFILNRAQHKDVIAEQATRVVSRDPVMVTQIANSSDFDHVIAADPFMAMIQPSPTWFSEYRICTPAQAAFENNYVNLVAPTLSDLNNITINGVSVGAWNPPDISKGSFVGGHVFAQVRLQPQTSYLIRSKSPIGLTGYGFSEFDSYGYPGGMQFIDSDPPLFTCPADVTLNCQKPATIAGVPSDCVAPTPDFISVMDFFDDCTPAPRLKITQTPIAGTLLKEGKHSVVIVATDGLGNSSQCVVMVTVGAPWADQNFGPATVSNPALNATVWGPGADPDNDGIPNVIEQSSGTDPKKKTSVLDIVHLSIADEGGVQFLKVTYKRPVAENGLVLILEGRRAAADSVWQSGPDIFEELPGETVVMQAYEQVSFKALETVGKVSEQLYFVRLRTGP